MIEIIPTNTCPPDLAELSRRSEEFASFAPQIQLDIADGVFAPVISWPYKNSQWDELERLAVSANLLPGATLVKYETHLMVAEPHRIGELLARSGCSRVIAHIEAFDGTESVKSAFAAWKAAGASEVGLAILADTPIEQLDAYARDCDCAIVMSIPSIGKQGAPFDTNSFDRIRNLREKNPGLVIAVDGGVSESNIAGLVRAGATRFGVGSAISKAQDPKAAYENLKSLAESALHPVR